MGVAVTPKSKDGACRTDMERKELEDSDQKCFDHRTFYVSYNLTSVFIIP